MLVRKSYRFRVYPTPKQETRLRAWQGALRCLWNLANEQRLMGYARPKGERRYPTGFDQINELTELRAALPWLADVPRNVCAQLLAELDKAWQRCFKRLGRAPSWKRRGRDTVGLCEPHPKVWRLDGATLRFPKIGNLRGVAHRPVEGKPKTCTLRCEAGQWFASISCELEIADPMRRDGPIVAIDRGVVNVVADSDGRIIEAPRFYERVQAQLARAQRTVSRRKKGSKNREKAKLRVARLHQKARRQREHFLHVLSHHYAKSHGVVVIEKLNVSGHDREREGHCRRAGFARRPKVRVEPRHSRRGMVPLRGVLAVQIGLVWRDTCRSPRRLLLANVQRMRPRRRGLASIAIRLLLHLVWLP